MRLQFQKNPHLAYGLPFMTVMIVGPYLMKHFAEVRYAIDLFIHFQYSPSTDCKQTENITYIPTFNYYYNYRYKYRKVTEASEEDLAQFGIQVKTPTEEITLEREYEKLKEMDIDSWEQVRGPRPWEENFETESIEAKK